MTEAVSSAPKRRKPLLSRVPAGFVQAVLKGHSGLGLAFAAAIYVVCLSGTLLVFYEEFIAWEAAAAPEVTSVSPQVVQAAIAEGVARGGPAVEHVYATLPSEEVSMLRIYIDADEDTNWAADSSGAIAGPLHTPWASFLSALHIYLHLPQTWGTFLVGMTGVALLSSLISGILAHPRILRDAFHLRIGGSRRLQEADLHNRIGVWGLPFHFIVSLSGAFLGLVTITVGVLGMAMFDGDVGKIYELFQPQEPVDNPAPAPLIDIAPMFGQAPTESTLERIILEHPAEQGAAALFEYRNPAFLAGEEHFAFNRAGEIYYSKVVQEAPVGERVLGSLAPLHFGWFGGIPIKIAYFILGLGLTYLAVGGVNIWLARRRDKGRPAPNWEKVWAATVWSQPLAFAAIAFIAVAHPPAGAGLLVAVWLVLTLGSLAAAAVLQPKMIARIGKLGTGFLLILVAGIHLIMVAPASSHMTAWAVDGAILAGAGLLLFLGFRSGPEPAVQAQ